MMNKRIGVCIVLIVCLAFVSYIYLKQSDEEVISEDIYVKSVVFKDQDNDLIPVSMNFYSETEIEESIRNRFEVMKSNEFEKDGLYPIFSDKLKIQSVEINDHILTIDFNNELYNNNNALDMLEALTYTMTDYEDIQQLKITIDGENVSYIPNSTIPLSSLTRDLGLNNFEETSQLLHQTIPVMVYHEKNIHNNSYYVPTTMRIDENESLKSQVQTILSYVQSKIHLLDASLDNGVLTIELDSNILLDNENIDRSLEDLIILSLSSLEDVENVEIKINGENITTKESSNINYNYMKI